MESALIYIETQQCSEARSTCINREIEDSIRSLPNAATIVNEADFGYRQIRKYLDTCPTEAHVLEVGSGPCVLLSQLKRDYPSFEIAGIEPIGPGFDKFEQAIESLMQEHPFDLHRGGYESFAATGQFDLIFSINVFEHLPDWRHFLRFVRYRLAPGGKCVILCPNYGFPYESHFSLPIVFNKKITQWIFRERIERHERENDCIGLWDSLNFANWRQINAYALSIGLDVFFDTSILRTMIERLGSDEAFARRQSDVARFANLALRLGVVRLFESRLLRRFNPYLKLVIRRPGPIAGRAQP